MLFSHTRTVTSGVTYSTDDCMHADSVTPLPHATRVKRELLASLCSPFSSLGEVYDYISYEEARHSKMSAIQQIIFMGKYIYEVLGLTWKNVCPSIIRLSDRGIGLKINWTLYQSFVDEQVTCFSRDSEIS